MWNVAEKPGVIYGMRLKGEAEYRYIGMTTRFRDRMNAHRRNAEKQIYDTPVYRWIQKYGWVAIEIDILAERSTRTDLQQAEIDAIERSRNSGHRLLNVSPGGDGGHTHEWTPERRAAHGAKIRALHAAGHYPPMSRELQEKATAAAAAKPITEERRQQMREHMTGREYTAERNAKVSAAKTQYWAEKRASGVI